MAFNGTNHDAAPPPYEAPSYGSIEEGNATPTLQMISTSAQHSGNAYTRGPERSSLGLIFHPVPTASRCHQPWIGVMFVKCTDIPRLMRDGFNWDDSNVLREEGSYESNVKAPYFCVQHGTATLTGWNQSWTHLRQFILRDTQNQPPLWVAHLDVYASELRILRGVNLDLLTTKNIAMTSARGLSGNKIYHYRAWKMEQCYNVVYDDLVMPGFWPWPGKNPVAMPDPSPVNHKKQKLFQNLIKRATRRLTVDVVRKAQKLFSLTE